jgi:hypothetical protein
MTVLCFGGGVFCYLSVDAVLNEKKKVFLASKTNRFIFHCVDVVVPSSG